MNLYRISQSKNTGYDTYDSAVVAAETPEEAQTIHPGGDVRWHYDASQWQYSNGSEAYSGSWTESVDDVAVQLIGLADPSVGKGVIVASFNAG